MCIFEAQNGAKTARIHVFSTFEPPLDPSWGSDQKVIDIFGWVRINRKIMVTKMWSEMHLVMHFSKNVQWFEKWVLVEEVRKFKAGSTRCVVHIRGASCMNVSKRFVESDTYSLLWCVNLPSKWRTRCDEWTNDTSTQIRHMFSYTWCANHDTWRITNTNHASCGPSFSDC